MFYPIYLNLRNKRVVVIGGGDVAERKVGSLADTGASIIVISPEVTPKLAALAKEGGVELHRRGYVEGDCRGAALVFSATGDLEVNIAVWKEASASGIPANTADQPDLCDFIMPAVVRRGELTIAISTGGKSPALAAELRKKLSEMIGPEYDQLSDLLARVRPEIRRRVPNEDDRKALHYKIIESDIIACLERNDFSCAERRLREIIEDFVCQERTP